jgi:hypothetical protein
MVIDAKDERVAAWYASYGAVSLLDAPLILVLPLRTIAVTLNIWISKNPFSPAAAVLT